MCGAPVLVNTGLPSHLAPLVTPCEIPRTRPEDGRALRLLSMWQRETLERDELILVRTGQYGKRCT